MDGQSNGSVECKGDRGQRSPARDPRNLSLAEATTIGGKIRMLIHNYYYYEVVRDAQKWAKSRLSSHNDKALCEQPSLLERGSRGYKRPLVKRRVQLMHWLVCARTNLRNFSRFGDRKS
eukprot:SAG31_NODE_1060_length_10111_cov_17.871354_6_plen_119_part_00